jgi:hypothetical protein
MRLCYFFSNSDGALLRHYCAVDGYASVQQRQQVSFKVQESKFIVSQNVDAGDVRDHQVQLFDSHLVLPNPTIDGLKLVEAFARGTLAS